MLPACSISPCVGLKYRPCTKSPYTGPRRPKSVGRRKRATWVRQACTGNWMPASRPSCAAHGPVALIDDKDHARVREYGRAADYILEMLEDTQALLRHAGC